MKTLYELIEVRGSMQELKSLPEGRVVDHFEANYADDSDWYLVYLNANNEFAIFEYATTRFANAYPFSGETLTKMFGQADDAIMNQYQDFLAKIHKEDRINDKRFLKGDILKITKGRKNVGYQGKVADTFRYYVQGTFKKQFTDYVVFEDGSKVNRMNCDYVG